MPFKEANKIENTTKRGDAAKRGHAVDMNVFVDDDGHFVFGHQVSLCSTSCNILDRIVYISLAHVSFAACMNTISGITSTRQ